MTTPLLPIQRSVRSARRRLFLQSLLNRVPVCWSVAMVGGLGWVVAEPFLAETPVAGVRWWVVGGLVAVSTVVAWVWAKRVTPSANSAALEIDTRFGLRERLTTAMGLSELERNTSAGQAVMADAAEKITPIAVKERFPVSPRWHTAFVPALAGCIALAAIYPINTVTDLFADTSETANKKADALVEPKLDPKVQTPFTQRNKPPELAARPDKSKELKELEEQINEMIRKFDTDPNRETQEKLREKVTELTNMEEKVKKFEKEKTNRLEKMEQQLKQLERLEKDQDFQDGPAKKLNEAMSKGDLKKAQDEFEMLKKKLQENKLSEEEKQQLAKQLEKMKEQIQKAEKNKDREKKLNDLAKKARDEGRVDDAESLERELKQLQSLNQEAAETTKQLAEKLDKAQKALEKGNVEEAAKELEQAAKQLQQAEGELQDIEDADQYLQRLKDEKKGACKKCEGDKFNDEFDEKDDAEWSEFGKPGAGRRKEDKDGKTASDDQRIRGLFDPKGKKTYGGSTKGAAFKTATTGELGPAIQSAAQEAPAAADSQRLPRDAKESVKEYFQNLGGQQPGGNK